jgi:hypothetical protein
MQARVEVQGGTPSSADNATMFSWIVDASLDDLRASLLDPGGLPLFPGLSVIQDPVVAAAVEAEVRSWRRDGGTSAAGLAV